MRRVTTWITMVLLAAALAACGGLQQQALEQPGVDPGVSVGARGVEAPQYLGDMGNVFDRAMVDETPSAWFVQFSGQPSVKGGRANAMANERASFRRAAAAEDIVYAERLNFETLFNGMSVVATPAEIGKLAKLPGVVTVFPVIEVSAPEPGEVAHPEMWTALDLTGASVAQDDLGLSGTGVRVAIIDTGVDYNHPYLGGGWGQLVTYGYDFVGDLYNASDPANDVPNPDDDPMDCNGHGTHVAGIVAADGEFFSGVAPGVEIGAYRVFGCAGSSSADVIVAALERAYLDGSDVVNMSLGAAYQWPQYPSAIASNNLVDNGVVVVASIGNSGDNGIYSAGAPGVGEKVIGVASFDNIGVLQEEIEVAGKILFPRLMTGSVAAPVAGSDEIVYVGQACNADPLVDDPTGKVALAVRGACAFSEKALKAQAAGATAVIVFNNAFGAFSGTLGEVSVDIPALSLSQADGEFVIGQLPTSVTWLPPRNVEDEISSFSSWGLAPDLSLKPDLGAPGGTILSTYPLALGGFAFLSGTSMSAPHVAGAVALLLEARPGVAASNVRTLLQNTAEPKPFTKEDDFFHAVHRQGAGMIDIPRAVTTEAMVSPSKLSLGESETGSFTETLVISNDSDEDVTFNLVHEGRVVATAGNTYNASLYLPAGVEATFSSDEITVPAFGTADVTVTITDPGLSVAYPQTVYGGYIQFVADDGVVALSVPYAGYSGDYQSIEVLVPTENDFPWLATLESGFFFNAPDGARYTMKGDDIAYVLAHFEHYSQVTKLEIVPLRQVGGARDLGVIELEYFYRNSTPNGFFAFEWDGSAKVNGRRTTLPMGDYQLKLSALKALGDPSNPAHWETWTSPVISIVRSKN